jgi:hypothetical protein
MQSIQIEVNTLTFTIGTSYSDNSQLPQSASGLKIDFTMILMTLSSKILLNN